MTTLRALLLASTLVFSWTDNPCEAEPRADRRPFLLGGIQLNEDDHERWAAALLRSAMNAVETTVYAHQGPWHSAELWYSDEEPSVLAEIRAARRNGLQVVLILRVALDHSDPANRFLWHGLTYPLNEETLAEWFRRYTAFAVQWARIAQRERVQVLGIASEMNALAATLPVSEVPKLPEYYLDDGKQLELRQLVDRHRHLFDENDRLAMGAGDAATLDEFLRERNAAERRWARPYAFAGDEERVEKINRRRRLLLRHWHELIDRVRAVYDGRLTLAANFDNYHEVAFWDRLDLIGINAYFPLRATLESPLDEAALTAAWRGVFAGVADFQAAQGIDRDVIFTELGYTRRSGVSFAPWSSSGFIPIFGENDEGRDDDRILLWSRQPIDADERAMAVRALFNAWRNDPAALSGILYWKLSSRLELARYEPFMLYLGSEAGDPLFEAMTRFARHVRPFADPFHAARPRYATWAEVISRGDAEAFDESRIGRRVPRPPRRALPLLHLAARSGHAGTVRQLAARRSRLRARDDAGYLAVHWACYQDDPSLAELLAPDGGSWRDDLGETPLMKCARLDNVPVARELLRLRADLARARNDAGQTALALATGQASARMVELLIAAGAGGESRDENGAVPLHLAARRGDPTIVATLSAATPRDVRDDAGNRPVDYAAYSGQAEAFRELWDPEQAHHRNAQGQTLLHHAAHGGNLEILQILLAAELDVDLADSGGRTPLHHAVLKTHAAAVELLLEHGALLDPPGTTGKTALHMAAEKNAPRILRRLLSLSPRLETTDADGNTPLHHAAGWGRVENVRLLLAAGARRDARNGDGRTPLDLAVESGRKRVAEMLANGTD